MQYITTKMISKKWGISERRIRQLLNEGRIKGAIKIGKTWTIPDNIEKPIDKRSTKLNNTDLIINIGNSFFDEVERLKLEYNLKRSVSKTDIKSLETAINLEWTYNSNGIEGNTLTLKETKIVLEGITIGGKTLREHLEVINHDKAILFLEDIVKDEEPINEWNVKSIHQLILREIDDKEAGKYRDCNVIIQGAKHIPPDYIRVHELMEKLIINYEKWNDYHPIIQAALLHGEFVKIHPFADGNGRTARLIMNLSLMKNGYLPVIIKNNQRKQYYNTLDKAHTTGDYTDFIKMINKLEKEMLNKYNKLL